MKRFFFVLVLVLTLSLSVQAYDTDVHEKITKKSLEISIVEQYLNNNLNISLDDSFNGNKARLLVENGSYWEDENITMRWLNHFYDPITGLGLNSSGTIIYGEPSLQWGKDSEDTLENAWSWKWARDSYYKALTESDINNRDFYFAYVFRSLGHIVHLIHDKAVPAHVRNDAHIFFLLSDRDMYEKYTKNKVGSLLYDGYAPVDNNTYDDFDKFWINAGKGLAEFTNSNF